MSCVTDESKLPLGWLHNMLNFLTLRMRSKMSVCAQMSRVTDESKLPLGWLHIMPTFLTLRMRSKMSMCAQMSRVTDESKLPLGWLQGGDQQLGTTSVEALWALRQSTQQIIGP
jgi:hypothetical protein